jgi:hypothetical protein
MTIEQALQKTLGFGVKKFIEKAIAGWYEMENDEIVETDGLEVTITDEGYETALSGKTKNTVTKFTIEQILLDPLAWQAVGKVEGWGKGKHGLMMYEWLTNMHRMIDALAEGKTIDEFLETYGEPTHNPHSLGTPEVEGYKITNANTTTPSIKNFIEETVERITIEYANLSGRESINRSVFREAIRPIINTSQIDAVRAYIKPHIEYCKEQNGIPECKNCGLKDIEQ